MYEEEEEMRLVLGIATSDSPYGASIGTKNETLVKIKDSADSKSERKRFYFYYFYFVFYERQLAWVLQILSLTWKEHYFPPLMHQTIMIMTFINDTSKTLQM